MLVSNKLFFCPTLLPFFMVSDRFEFAFFIVPIFFLSLNSLLFDLADALLFPRGKSLRIFTRTLGLNLFLWVKKLTERETGGYFG